jgi:hypothetical protein
MSSTTRNDEKHDTQKVSVLFDQLIDFMNTSKNSIQEIKCDDNKKLQVQQTAMLAIFDAAVMIVGQQKTHKALQGKTLAEVKAAYPLKKKPKQNAGFFSRIASTVKSAVSLLWSFGTVAFQVKNNVDLISSDIGNSERGIVSNDKGIAAAVPVITRDSLPLVNAFFVPFFGMSDNGENKGYLDAIVLAALPLLSNINALPFIKKKLPLDFEGVRNHIIGELSWRQELIQRRSDALESTTVDLTSMGPDALALALGGKS